MAAIITNLTKENEALHLTQGSKTKKAKGELAASGTKKTCKAQPSTPRRPRALMQAWYCSQCKRADHHGPECPWLVGLLTADERHKPLTSCGCESCERLRLRARLKRLREG